MAFKLSKSELNKLVSYVDREFTWDRRGMLREGTSELGFNLYASRWIDNTHIRVAIKQRKCLWVCLAIKTRGHEEIVITRGILNNFAEVRAFKNKVREIG